jgi:hypothetical protein
MHGRRYNFRASLSRRCLTGLVLVTFTLGNVGWPLDLGKTASGTGRCAMTGAARCCCGLEKSKSTCGCFKAPVLANKDQGKKSSCCQKKRTAEKSAALVVNCDCNDSPFPGFIVSAQPRIASAFVEAPALTGNSAVPPPAPPALPGGSSAPETPPPRSSVS